MDSALLPPHSYKDQGPPVLVPVPVNIIPIQSIPTILWTMENQRHIISPQKPQTLILPETNSIKYKNFGICHLKGSPLLNLFPRTLLSVVLLPDSRPELKPQVRQVLWHTLHLHKVGQYLELLIDIMAISISVFYYQFTGRIAQTQATHITPELIERLGFYWKLWLWLKCLNCRTGQQIQRCRGCVRDQR